MDFYFRCIANFNGLLNLGIEKVNTSRECVQRRFLFLIVDLYGVLCKRKRAVESVYVCIEKTLLLGRKYVCGANLL